MSFEKSDDPRLPSDATNLRGAFAQRWQRRKVIFRKADARPGVPRKAVQYEIVVDVQHPVVREAGIVEKIDFGSTSG